MTNIDEYLEKVILEKAQLKQQLQQQGQALSQVIAILFEGVDKNTFTHDELQEAAGVNITFDEKGVTIEYPRQN